MKRRFWSEQDEQCVRDGLESGLTYAQVAARLGRSECAVKARARRIGARQIGYFWRDDEVAQLRAALAAGLTYAAIAEQLGRSESSVTQYVKTHRLRPNGVPRQGVRWDASELQRLRDGLAAGQRPREIAAALKRSLFSVYKNMQRLGLKAPEAKPRPELSIDPVFYLAAYAPWTRRPVGLANRLVEDE